MSTDQKYDGKESHANSPQNLEETVNTDPQTATAETSAEPITEPPVTITLPSFIARHVYTHEKSEQLSKALKNVFREFYDSDKYHAIEDINQMVAYRALQMDLESIVNTATTQQAGPIPDQPVVVPDNLEENPFQFEAYEVYMCNPLNCEDVAKLQEWVELLQKMSIRQNYVIEAYKKIEAGNSRIVESQEKAIGQYEGIQKNLEKQIEILTSDNTRLRKLVPGETAPSQKYALTLDASVVKPYRGASEVEILTYALDEYRTSRLSMYKEEVAQAELVNAYCSHSDAQVAQDLLNDLRDSAVRLAEHNYEAAKYQGDSAAYLKYSEREKKQFYSDRQEFFDLHLTEDEKESDVETEEVFSGQSITPEPDYLSGLTDDNKKLVKGVLKMGGSDELAARVAKTLSEYHPEQADSPGATETTNEPEQG